MAVSEIEIVSIIGVNETLDDVVNFLGKSEAFQPEEVSSFYSDTKKFLPLLKQNPFDEPMNRLTSLITSLGKNVEDLKYSDKNLTEEQALAYADEFSASLEELLNNKIKIEQQLEDKLREISQIEHFVGLDLDFKRVTSCEYIKIRFGRLPKESFIKLDAYKNNPYMLFFKCTSDKTHYWGFYMVPIDHAKEVDMIFSSLYFERLKIYGIDSTPERAIADLKSQVDELKIEKKKVKDNIENLWNFEFKKYSAAYNKILECDTYYNIRSYGASYGNNFILTGWIPKEKREYFKKNLDKIHGIEYSIENASESKNHPPPTLLKNKKFFRPFEFFVDMYGLPNYKEIDPTAFVAVTYILMFGIMFGDFGNGLVLSIVGYIMWKLKNLKLGQVLIPCGVCSMFFGVLFGSCFGFEDAFDWLYKGVFHLSEKPISVMEPKTTNLIIYLTVGLGAVLLIISMIINIYSLCKQRKLSQAIFGPNSICGLVFFSSVIGGVLLQFIMGIKVLNTPYIILLIVLPLILIMFREVLEKLFDHDPDWKPESWGEYISQNAFELFEVVLSYATNTISFLRVGVYVLVHAGMLLFVFTLAEMAGGISSVVIIVLGNIVVIGLEGLLAGIQVLRLEFYEIFSRCYIGDGEPFTPVVVKNRLVEKNN